MIGKVRNKKTGKEYGVLSWLNDGCICISDSGFIEVMSDWEYEIISKNGRRYIDE